MEFRKPAEEDIQVFIEELNAKEQMNNLFIKNKMDETIEKIYNYLLSAEYKYIDNENLACYPEKYPVNRHDFQLVFGAILNYAQEKRLNSCEEENHFPNQLCFMIYKDMKITLFTMSGQGTHEQMLCDYEGWYDEISFHYEEARNYILKNM